MVVDLGGGTTDIAVISMSGIVYSRFRACGGQRDGRSGMQYLKRKYNLLVGERTAEQIKMAIGQRTLWKSAYDEVKGRNLIEGVPRTVTIDDSEYSAKPSMRLRPFTSIVSGLFQRVR